MYNRDGIKIFMLIHVDEILITRNYDVWIHSDLKPRVVLVFVQFWGFYFILCLLLLLLFVGIDAVQTPTSLHLSQHKYFVDLPYMDRNVEFQTRG